MAIIAYKFVKHDVHPLEHHKGAWYYDLKVKCMVGQRLTRDEKDRLARELSTSSYGRCSIARGGWMFSFYGLLPRYLVRQYGSWCEYYAPDRTSLRRALYGRIQEIHEIPYTA